MGEALNCQFEKYGFCVLDFVITTTLSIKVIFLQPWCPTQIDKTQEESIMGGLEGWGYCSPECPIEADGWRYDDNTFIVKYSDIETWRMTAILTMIYTGGGLLVVGLITTLIVMVCGLSASLS